MGDHVSRKYELPFGAFLGDIIREHKFNFHSYADDTQLYISLDPSDDETLCHLTSGLAAVKKCMQTNFLKLTGEKTKILLVGPQTKRELVLPNRLEQKSWAWVLSETQAYILNPT